MRASCAWCRRYGDRAANQAAHRAAREPIRSAASAAVSGTTDEERRTLGTRSAQADVPATDDQALRSTTYNGGWLSARTSRVMSSQDEAIQRAVIVSSSQNGARSRCTRRTARATSSAAQTQPSAQRSGCGSAGFTVLQSAIDLDAPNGFRDPPLAVAAEQQRHTHAERVEEGARALHETDARIGVVEPTDGDLGHAVAEVPRDREHLDVEAETI